MKKGNWWSKATDPAMYQKRVDIPPFKFVASMYGENDSIFDVGCGSAIWADNHKFYKKKGMYKGTDYTPEYVEESQKQHPEYEWEVMDANNLKEEDNSWDIYLAIHALEYTRGYEKPILEGCRIARKKVVIVWWVPLSQREDNVIRTVNQKNEVEYSLYSENLFNRFIHSIKGWKVIVSNLIINDQHGRPNYIFILEKR